ESGAELVPPKPPALPNPEEFAPNTLQAERPNDLTLRLLELRSSTQREVIIINAFDKKIRPNGRSRFSSPRQAHPRRLINNFVHKLNRNSLYLSSLVHEKGHVLSIRTARLLTRDVVPPLNVEDLDQNPDSFLHNLELWLGRCRYLNFVVELSKIVRPVAEPAEELYIRAVKLCCLICANPPSRVLLIFKLLEMIPKPKITVARRMTICLLIMEKGLGGARGITEYRSPKSFFYFVRTMWYYYPPSWVPLQNLCSMSWVENEADDVQNDADIIPATTEMHETEPNHDSNHKEEEIPHQVSESHNLNAKVKTTLTPAEQDNQQRANSINELNGADSSIKDFVDVKSPVDQFKVNEKTYTKQENERLHRELEELKSQLSAKIRCDIAEHTHLNVLNRLLLQTRSEYAQNKLSQATVNETFDNLSSQLRESADRRLENMPVGFEPILNLIKTSKVDNAGSPSKK
ncbi:hypothetical protein F5877DRAFT_72966, partial [Lentinula edodes]